VDWFPVIRVLKHPKRIDPVAWWSVGELHSGGQPAAILPLQLDSAR